MDSHDELHAWARGEIEDVVGDKRVASVREEIDELAGDCVSLKLQFERVVKQLGGRKPSKKGSVNVTGAWGQIDEDHYVVDVPEAMGHLDTILTGLWIVVAGCKPADGKTNLALREMAKDAVAVLSPANVKA